MKKKIISEIKIIESKWSININDIKKYVNNTKKIEHIKNVAITAYELAMYYAKEFIEQAYIAGLLHDIARENSPEKLLKLANKHNHTCTPIEKNNPLLLHSVIGSYQAKSNFSIQDNDIILAIRNHITGKPKMSQIEQLIFISDSVNRMNVPTESKQQVRQFFYVKNLNYLTFLAAKINLTKCLKNNRQISTSLIECYNFYYAKEGN